MNNHIKRIFNKTMHDLLNRLGKYIYLSALQNVSRMARLPSRCQIIVYMLKKKI